MAKLLVVENFQYKGYRRAGVTLDIADSHLVKEVEKGLHEKELYGKKRFMSGLLNHCIPANDATARLIAANLPDGVDPRSLDLEPSVDITDEEDDSHEIADIHAQFDEMGKAYDRRWGLKRLQNELLKAKKATGTGKAEVKEE